MPADQTASDVTDERQDMGHRACAHVGSCLMRLWQLSHQLSGAVWPAHELPTHAGHAVIATEAYQYYR